MVRFLNLLRLEVVLGMWDGFFFVLYRVHPGVVSLCSCKVLVVVLLLLSFCKIVESNVLLFKIGGRDSLFESRVEIGVQSKKTCFE